MGLRVARRKHPARVLLEHLASLGKLARVDSGRPIGPSRYRWYAGTVTNSMPYWALLACRPAKANGVFAVW